MRLGIRVVHPPAASAPATLRTLAQAAETLGYRSLWVDDPLRAGPAHTTHRSAVDLDPLSSLAYAAALTDRIQLGTCVRVGDGVPPHHLARALETVDRLSVGRLTVALVGSGEPGAVDPIDEVLDARDGPWSPEGRRGPARTRPGRQQRPPLLLTGSNAAALTRVGRRGDGLFVTDPGPGPGLHRLAAAWAAVAGAAKASGREVDDLLLAVLVVVGASEPAPAVADRVHAVQALGATDVVLTVDDRPSLDEALARYAATAEAVELEAVG